WPMDWSLLAEMEPTWAISLLVVTGLDCLASSATAAATALSIPRFRSMGLKPAATYFRPSWTMAWASTVAVVVPSPALSEVFEATSLTSWAPMFSNLSFSSIFLATETPSLVTVGAPNERSSTTLRPLGPRVVFTALARTLTPRTMRTRASSANRTYLAAIVSFLRKFGSDNYWITARISSSRMTSSSSPSTFTDWPAYLPNRTLSPAFTSTCSTLPSSVFLPGPTAITSP